MVKINTYEKHEFEKNRFLNEVKNQAEIEKNITKEIKKIMKKNKNSFFNLDEILNIKEVKKYFLFIIITGDRNIGKTTAMKNYVAKNYIEKGEKYVWLRTQENSALDVLTNSQNWLESKGWSILKSESQVIIKKDEKKPPSVHNRLDTVGYYYGLKNIDKKKSIDYPKTSTIILDEFSDGINLKNKFNLLTSFANTVFRYRKNPKIILSANFKDQGDSILKTLGMKQAKNKAEMLTFNWIARALVWNIPAGFYRKTGSNDTLAYRMAVAGGINLFRQEYGGDFNNSHEWNIKELSAFVNKKDICYFLIGDRKFIYGKSLKTNEYYVVDYEKRPVQKLKEFVFYHIDFMKNKNSIFINNKQYKLLKQQWKKELLFSDEVEIAEIIIDVLAGEIKDEKIIEIVGS